MEAKVLQKNWITQGLIDFEYKKYVLLDYLKAANASFDKNKLYPYLSDLVFHYRNLLLLKEKKKLLADHFPKTISKVDIKKLELTYTQLLEDSAMMAEIEDIISFALPEIKGRVGEGKDLYDFVESQLEIEPVGICPIYANEGYLFIDESYKRHTRIYRYQITVFESQHEKYRGIRTDFIEKKKRNLGQTFERLKMELVKTYKELPNPAAYLIGTKANYPIRETILPIAKRMLVAYVNKTSNM